MCQKYLLDKFTGYVLHIKPNKQKLHLFTVFTINAVFPKRNSMRVRSIIYLKDVNMYFKVNTKLLLTPCTTIIS